MEGKGDQEGGDGRLGGRGGYQEGGDGRPGETMREGTGRETRRVGMGNQEGGEGRPGGRGWWTRREGMGDYAGGREGSGLRRRVISRWADRSGKRERGDACMGVECGHPHAYSL